MDVERRGGPETEGSIECWDDDGDLQCFDDVQFRSPSAATSTCGSVRISGHRDSISSRLSARSELESNIADDDWQVLVRDNDDTTTEEAIASAHNAGIPIPKDVPRSALLGGTIKKLNGKKIRKMVTDDWSEDLEMPAMEGPLALKIKNTATDPDTLLQIGTSTQTSPAKSSTLSDISPHDVSRSVDVVASQLSQYSEHDNLDDIQDVPTIKFAEPRSPPKISNITDLNTSSLDKDAQDFENDFDIPANESLLKLATPKEITSSPTANMDDLDVDWAEGSIGVRFGGTKREGRSTYSSSVSALSPSMSSCLTAESEEDAMDGLVLPDGPLNLEDSLKKRHESGGLRDTQAADLVPELQKATDGADFFADLDVGDGNIFCSPILNLNKNIKRVTTQPTSPRRTGTSITFMNKPLTGVTRIPRLSGHDRSHSNLEPVLESGDSMSRFRRTPSRLGVRPGHSSQSSTSRIPSVSATSPPSTPPTSTRRSFGSRQEIPRADTSTSAQFLRTKRSMPAMRAAHSSLPAQGFQRPSSRQDGSGRPSGSVRPETPVERHPNHSKFALAHRSQAPFLPAGASQSQSHHANVKYSRHSRRHDSDSSNDMTASQRPTSRLSLISRPDTPGRLQESGSGVEALAITKRTITRPARRQNFGNGSELQTFDDLPTSASLEKRFVKTPVGHGAPRSFRSKLTGSTISNAVRTGTPVSQLEFQSPLKTRDITPRFARDTTASRNAREQRIASLSAANKDRENGPLLPLTTNWRNQGSVRVTDYPMSSRSRRAKSIQSKPHLIRPMGAGVHEAKSIKGMRYNPLTCRWEGNENALSDFDIVQSSKSPKPAPALITSASVTQGVQVVGSMVFDPQRMCWLKIASTQPGQDGLAVVEDDIDNVFSGLDDLKEKESPSRRSEVDTQNLNDLELSAGLDDQSGGDSSDEWAITEEFDVGPEFIKRQRAEEEKWRRKCAKWVSTDRQMLGDHWRWRIRDLVGLQQSPNTNAA